MQNLDEEMLAVPPPGLPAKLDLFGPMLPW
jgi:hypothetical protein